MRVLILNFSLVQIEYDQIRNEQRIEAAEVEV
jgi:hypothetical protein